MPKENKREIAGIAIGAIGIGVNIILAIPDAWAIPGYVVGGVLILWGVKSFWEPLDKAWRSIMSIRIRSPIYRRRQAEKEWDTTTPVLGDNVSAFYSERSHMDDSDYDGLRKELNSSKKEVWAAWHGGQYAISSTSPERRKKISRLILLHPWNADVGEYGTKDEAQARDNIIRATEEFQKADVKVKWFDGPFSIITVVDPHDKDDNEDEWARARVEPWLPLVDAESWQNYVVYKEHNSFAFRTIKTLFNQMWDKADDAPTGKDLEKYRNPKPSGEGRMQVRQY